MVKAALYEQKSTMWQFEYMKMFACRERVGSDTSCIVTWCWKTEIYSWCDHITVLVFLQKHRGDRLSVWIQRWLRGGGTDWLRARHRGVTHVVGKERSSSTPNGSGLTDFVSVATTIHHFARVWKRSKEYGSALRWKLGLLCLVSLSEAFLWFVFTVHLDYTTVSQYTLRVAVADKLNLIATLCVYKVRLILMWCVI